MTLWHRLEPNPINKLLSKRDISIMNGSSRAAPSPPVNPGAQPSGASSAEAGSKPIDIPILSKAKRAGSYASDVSSAPSPSLSSSFSSSLRKTSSGWVKSSPTVNVHTTCGRHTDQYFFSGPSLTKLARAFMGKKK
ncbi:hypothetical protein TOPH_00675 [Tolypocladium ophioglossoides CBS 100239]|uniref:Uncharacterized protein n=1 Tax=Tolypocladium ophioglossoides (strain CBS 100239) TaxID=1163406 RepID=A0A0L0NMB3_TOLOC|nr:hypothetical protein TOPH_00675 [Tolypocladium ophioglossoides CBS 100239]